MLRPSDAAPPCYPAAAMTDATDRHATARSRAFALAASAVATLAACAALVPSAASAAGSSFRDGGDATYTDVSPPPAWDDAHRLWRVPLPGWSNSSPVVVGDQVCTLSEPVRISCFDRRTGALRWQADSPYAVTIPDAERAAWEAKVAAHAEAAARADALQREYSALRRELRRAPTDTALAEKLSATGTELSTLRARLEDAPPFDTPPVREIIGYSTHSPVSDGTRIFAFFGQGVATAFDLKGNRLWATFVEPAPAMMRGYHLGTAATPVIAGDLVVIGQGHLVALDRATGRKVWTGPVYEDFGTPAVGTIGGIPIVATPAGQIVRARDGVVLQEGLDDPWFAGPTLVGDRLVYAGEHASDINNAAPPPKVSMWQLAATGDTVTATRLWTQSLPTRDRIYVSPVIHGDVVYAVDTAGVVWAVDATSSTRVVHEPLGPIYPSPLWVGDRLRIGSENGRFLTIDPATRTVEHVDTIGLLRSTPVYAGSAVYVRTLDALVAWGTK